MSHLQHFDKVAQLAMGVNALHKIKSVCPENERKIEKRAWKKAALGACTILSVQEGQQRIQELDTQVET